MAITFGSFKEWLFRPTTLLTIVYCYAYLSIGMLIAGLGPSIPTFGRNTKSSDTTMGFAVTSRALGYLTGSISGPLFHRLPGNRMIAVGLVIVSLCSFLTPHLTSFAFLCVSLFVQGLSMGMLDTGANLMTLWLHGKDCDPYIQSLHAGFAIGAVIAPAIIKGLLSGGHAINAAWYAFGIAALPALIGVLVFPSPQEPSEESSEISNVTQGASTGNDIEHGSLELGNVQSVIDSPSSDNLQVELNSVSKSPVMENRSSAAVSFSWNNRYVYDYKPWIMVIGIAVFLGCYVGGEVATASFLTTFALRRGLTTEDGGALITTLFWVSIAVGRIIAIPLSLFVSPAKMLTGDLVGTIITTCIVWVFSSKLVPFSIFIFVYGLFMASTFPTAITLLQTIVPVTGNMATAYIVGASLGEMLVPLIVSSTFDSSNYMSVIYVQFGSVVLGSIIMLGVWFVAWKITRQKRFQESFATPTSNQNDSTESNLTTVTAESAKNAIVDEPVRLEI